jgi:hypothetical protein
MYQEKIKILNPKVLQALVERCLYVFWRVLRVPQLASDKDVGTRNAASLNADTYFHFVSIDGSAVEVTVSRFEGSLHGALDFAGLRLPCAKADGRYLSARIEGEMRGDRHGSDEVRSRYQKDVK